MFIINFIVNYLEKQKRISQTMSELSSLSDRDLKELGITRYQIPQIAYESVINL